MPRAWRRTKQVRQDKAHRVADSEPAAKLWLAAAAAVGAAAPTRPYRLVAFCRPASSQAMLCCLNEIDPGSPDIEPCLHAAADEVPVCRICWESGGRLVTPCLCTGSIGHVHKACLRKWLIKRRASGIRHSLRCEVCHGQLHSLPPGLVLRSSAAAAARITGRAAAATAIVAVGLPVLAVAICGGVAATVVYDTAVYALDTANPRWWQRRNQRQQRDQALAAWAAQQQVHRQQAERLRQWRQRLAQQQQERQQEAG